MDHSDPHDLRSADHEILETDTIALAGIKDEGHARAVEEALQAAEGVKEVKMHENAENVEVTFDTRKTHIPALHDLILNTGYHPAGPEVVDNSE